MERSWSLDYLMESFRWEPPPLSPAISHVPSAELLQKFFEDTTTLAVNGSSSSSSSSSSLCGGGIQGLELGDQGSSLLDHAELLAASNLSPLYKMKKGEGSELMNSFVPPPTLIPVDSLENYNSCEIDGFGYSLPCHPLQLSATGADQSPAINHRQSLDVYLGSKDSNSLDFGAEGGVSGCPQASELDKDSDLLAQTSKVQGCQLPIKLSAEQLKVEKRKHQNRESAKRCRLKKKEKADDLEKEVSELKKWLSSRASQDQKAKEGFALLSNIALSENLETMMHYVILARKWIKEICVNNPVLADGFGISSFTRPASTFAFTNNVQGNLFIHDQRTSNNLPDGLHEES